MAREEDTAAYREGEAPVPAEGADPVSHREAGELELLRAEVEALRARVGTEQRRRARLLAVRRAVAAVLIALVAVCAVGGVIGVWAARTALDTDRWVATVGPLPEDPAVNAALSAYLTDELFDQLDVERRLSDALPDRASFIAAPVTAAVHDHVRDSVGELLRTEEFQELWRSANRSMHPRIVAVLENRAPNVEVRGDTVTLDLLPLVNNLINALEDRLPTVFGKRIDLPPVKSGEFPPGLRDRIDKALGVTLPEDFAQVRLYDRHRLGQLQDAVLLCRRAVVGLVVAVPLLLALALWVSPRPRRTLLQLGLWLVVTTTAMTAVLRAVRDHLLGQVRPGVYREGVRTALWDVFEPLRTRGDQLLWAGVALAVLAYLVGPGRLPVALRHCVVQGAQATGRLLTRVGQRARSVGRSRPWIRGHADVLRVGGVVVAVLTALLLSSWAGLLVVAAGLAAYEGAVTLLARDGTAAPAGETPPGDLPPS
ncbi:hypothetical protein [Streptomyces poonensis]|uniref:Integral membrane protein n=1 Tax=Streptomyces poonensis TaxID=68255 RepID=A0A918PC87_9ACTN|nr:hypothetical protein [Streptomyces poonensis]GGY99156.1 hypothetical protein GCM10010365_17310 [Streptomyces poonensis]